MNTLSRVLGLALTLGSLAFAGTILTTGPDSGLGINVGYIHTGQSSQPFSLSSESVLTSMTISTWTQGIGPSQLDWTFSTGSFGTGTVDASGSSAASDTLNFFNGYDVYYTTATLPSVDLVAGDYWLTLTSDSPSATWVYWGTTSGASFGGGQYILGALNGRSNDYVLELDGSSSAPEPGTMGLMGLSAAGILALFRRRSSKA